MQTQAYENLALRKPAWQANIWPDDDKYITWGANKSVDGKYSDRSADGNQCTISHSNRLTATLRVDLERLVSISHINIYYRTDNFPSPGAFYDRFAGFFLFVSNTTAQSDGHLCFHDIQNVNGTPIENQTIICHVYGRYVIYYNERKLNVMYPAYYSRYAYNEICELEVIGCSNPGFYGKSCDKKCPNNCQEQRCDIITGDCLGCIPGHQGPRCDTLCNKNSYGMECSLSCGNCSDGETCHHVNGTCMNGCNKGAKGDKCKNECQLGYYGKGCIHKCSDNCGVPNRCDRFTGECEGGCQPGWQGIRCIKHTLKWHNGRPAILTPDAAKDTYPNPQLQLPQNVLLSRDFYLANLVYDRIGVLIVKQHVAQIVSARHVITSQEFV
ncbi:uncharacterized protein LOC133193085 [Saccostrea echinata]|uniref:uncharacterized protein LOC133193085 n=1 Tax=Saccostrea echinata TaxID=191078 RepID=UPI002A7F5870|nr:uncharacterized protein LOC133193085 [Saccostrea echinata]